MNSDEHENDRERLDNGGITAEPIPTEAINQIGVIDLDISQITARPALSEKQKKP